MKENAAFLYSKLLETLAKERDQLLTAAEELREKLDETVKRQQEIEAQRDAALEDISQVTTWETYMFNAAGRPL